MKPTQSGGASVVVTAIGMVRFMGTAVKPGSSAFFDNSSRFRPAFANSFCARSSECTCSLLCGVCDEFVGLRLVLAFGIASGAWVGVLRLCEGNAGGHWHAAIQSSRS